MIFIKILLTFWISLDLFDIQAEARSLQEESIEKKVLSKKYSLNLNYASSVDLNEDYPENLFFHSFGASLSYKLSSKFTSNISAGLRYQSLNFKIQERSRGGFFTWGVDPSLSLQYRFRSYGFSLGHSFFIDEINRYNGRQGVSELRSWVSHPTFLKLHTMSHSFGYAFFWNSFRENVLGLSHSQHSFSYVMSHGLRVNKYFSFGLNFYVRSSIHLDDFVSFAFGNSQSLNFNYKSLYASVSYQNKGDTRFGVVRPWAVNIYHKPISMSVGYVF